MNPRVIYVIKGVAGVIVVLVMLGVVTRWYGEYRQTRADSSGAPPVVATATPEPQAEGEKESEPTKTATPKPIKTIIVRTDGLRFREQPARDSNAIRGLKKGETLVVYKQQDAWYQVRDAKGTVGWISSSPAYTRSAE